MRKIFTDPTIEVRNFAVENIVTTSVPGTSNAEEVEALKMNSAIEKVTIDAGTVLNFTN